MKLLSLPAVSTLQQITKPATYEYTALPLDTSNPKLRIVSLLPGRQHEKVKCSLQIASLENAHLQYTAVSYTWGSTEKTQTVACDGKQLPVTNNLYAALRNLRMKYAPVTIWIDQLSINQSDSAECENQVGIMGKIYKNAQGVVIWLGETQHNSTQAIALCKQMTKVIDAHDRDISRDIIGGPEQFGLPKWADNVWYSLGLLLRRPWFQRTWTIQEVVMARNAAVQCGRDNIPWTSLSRVASFLDFETGRPSGVANPTSTSLTHRVRLIDQLREAPMDLIDLLLETRDYQATDARDKVYALLDLALSDVAPDYTTKTAEILYIQIAVAYLASILVEPCSEELRSRKVMSLISHAGSANQQLRLPSWVPDWSRSLQSRPFVLRPSFSIDPIPGYKAGGPVLSQFDMLSHHRLRLSAIFCGSVRIVGSKWLAKGDMLSRKQLREDAGEWLAEAMSINYMAGQTYLTGGPENEIFKKTVLAGRNRYGDLASPDDIQTMYNGWRTLEQRTFTIEYVKERIHGDQWLYFHATMAAQGRVFMLSSHGHTGLVPHGTRCGDRIAVLLGAGAPVVLRPVGYDMDGHLYSLLGGRCTSHYRSQIVQS
ncbi:hypothetical protein A1O7_03272 [Cladophialophora yegresii CBS 114405]|uniref:Heterokaryon incompatibility domain-containing protein n=1 Tax=Cladophialophora yegresii CBS 114405 TaxID=1182544 RepID=W9W462_9EURO|nr:uncharacterized protein A1O7_03272 [Cladophialophora yegresii CBS 114405]EXJ62832.1 hypothetical protein A1O7_03272 [Cladophialophora yegresii CBS 114405]